MTNHSPPRDEGSQPRNQLLEAAIQRRVSQLAAINTVAAAVSRSLDLDETLQTALEAALSVIGVDAAAISLLDREANAFVPRAQRGLDLDPTAAPDRFPLDDGLLSRVIGEDRVLTGYQPADDLAAFGHGSISAQAMAPMHAGGRINGVLGVFGHGDYRFSDEELDVLQAMADQVGIALENARLYALVRQQQKQLTAIIESAADAIIATDDRGRISVINAAAKHLFNINAEQIIGAPLAEAPLQPVLLEELRRTMRHMGSDESAITFEVTLPSEQTLMAMLSRLRSFSLLVAGRSNEGWVVVLHDTSHLKAAEAARMEFVEAAAHDLRNPLGVTLSSLIMLQDFIAQDDPMSTEIFQIALDAVNQMQELLDDMVHMEHIATGGGFETERMAPYPLLLEALAEMEPYIISRDQTYEVDASEHLPPIDVSPVWFRRALTNYLSNASKYTQEGGHIILHARVQDDEFVVEVQDNGPGIPPEAQGRLFERFYRVPASKEKARGTGLGLAIVRSVAEAHEGRVYARSLPEQGSVFGIVLPLAAAGEPENH